MATFVTCFDRLNMRLIKFLMRMKIQHLLCALLLSSASYAQEVSVKIINPTARQRHEVVQIDAREVYAQLRVSYGSSLIVRNAYRQQVTYQLSHDSLLLVDSKVRPMGTVTYTVVPGQAVPMKSAVDGRLYAWRVDDFTWENDLGAYRAYGPALQRTGEKAFGIDVWLKSVPRLVVAERYHNVFVANRQGVEWRKQGRNDEADSLKRENSLHLDHGNGLDCYSVGPSLGCGAPGVLIGDSIAMPYCFQRYKVLENGPLRFTVEFVYGKTTIDGQKDVVEHRRISLDKGSYFNRTTVWYEYLRRPIRVCAGVVIHSADTKSIRLGKDFVQYADPTDSPERHSFQIYVAAVFPYGIEKTRFVPCSRLQGDIAGHAIGEKILRENERFVYYFGAGWTGRGVENQDVWQQKIDLFRQNLVAPLKVSIAVKGA